MTPSPPAPTTAHALFAAEQLPFPPVPAILAASLAEQRKGLFATRALPVSPYDHRHFVGELGADPAMPDYAVVGFDGHGFNSWAAHYYLVGQAIALFIQLPWGGAYLDVEPARADIAEVFGWAAELQSKVAQATHQGSIPAGWRLQVSASRLRHSGWRWLAPGRDNTAVPWNPPAGMAATLLQQIDDLLAGRQSLQG